MGSLEVEEFIESWPRSGASERSNYQSFFSELCKLLDLPQHDPHRPDDEDNACVRSVLSTSQHNQRLHEATLDNHRRR